MVSISMPEKPKAESPEQKRNNMKPQLFLHPQIKYTPKVVFQVPLLFKNKLLVKLSALIYLQHRRPSLQGRDPSHRELWR
jgi:hypothetical protein